MTDFVCGFLFNERRNSVVLIQKNRPAWQAGAWNGVGGHIEESDEYPKAAMIREFFEETGLHIDTWEPFSTISGTDFRVHFYRAFSDQLDEIETKTDEEVDIFLLNFLPKKMIANTRWLIEMALSMDADTCNYFDIKEAA